MARFANSPLKTVLIVVLCVALGMGAIFGLRAIFSEAEKETKKTISVGYSVGDLSDAGKYLESEGSIYNKEAFECQGLRITPNFDNTITYEVFFYDEDGYFISKTKKKVFQYVIQQSLHFRYRFNRLLNCQRGG